jgi:predicted nucleic acid-binding protein
MLLDTAGLLCLHHRAEPFHAVAVREFRAAPSQVTHNYVLAEFVALANARRLPRTLALQFLVDLIDDPRIDVIWVDETLHHEALNLLFQRPDKEYSLCDAVSFLLIRRYGIRTALTSDKHFEQEGFQRLLV